MKTPILETRRLILRPITLDDAPAIQKHFAHWEIIKFTQAPWPYPENGAEENMRDMTLPALKEGRQISWALTMPHSENANELIGRIDYRFQDGFTDRGFWIALHLQGQGLMKEAVIATQDYMFLECGLEQLTVKNSKSNAASHKLKEHLGGIYIGEEGNCCHMDEPAEVWEVTKENWLAAREKIKPPQG